MIVSILCNFLLFSTYFHIYIEVYIDIFPTTQIEKEKKIPKGYFGCK